MKPASPITRALRGAAIAALLGAPATGVAQERSPAAPRAPDGARPARAWNLALTGEQLWESNVRFIRPDDRGDFVSRIGAAVTRSWQGRRGRVALTAAGDGTRFLEQADLNRFTYGAGADASRQFSRRLAGQLGYAMRSALARDLAGPANAGVLLPLVFSRTNSAAGLASYRLSPTTVASVDARYDRVTFDSPRPVDSLRLSDGWTAAQRVSLTRQASRSATIGAGYELARSSSQGREGDAHTALATWERRLGRRLGARVAAGVVHLQPLGGGEAHTLLAGGAELRARAARDVFAARYERSASQAFGFGRILATDQLSAAYDRDLTPALAVGLRASRAASADPAGGFRLTTGSYAAEAHYALARGVTVGGRLFVRRRDDGAAAPVVASRGAALSFAYGRLVP